MCIFSLCALFDFLAQTCAQMQMNYLKLFTWEFLVSPALIKINVDLEANPRTCSWIIGDASAVTKWNQVHTRTGEARGQIDPFPEMNYL